MSEGLSDMIGYVWEWCQDGYDGGYYEHSAVVDSRGPTEVEHRVIRGGAFSTTNIAGQRVGKDSAGGTVGLAGVSGGGVGGVRQSGVFRVRAEMSVLRFGRGCEELPSSGRGAAISEPSQPTWTSQVRSRQRRKFTQGDLATRLGKACPNSADGDLVIW